MIILNEKDTFRSIMIKTIVIIFIVNAILIFLYSTFLFNQNVDMRFNQTRKDIQEKFSYIEKEINVDNVDELASKYNVNITLSDENNDVIFETNKNSNIKYEKSKIINIDNKLYLLNVSTQLDLTFNLLILLIMLVEMAIFLVITIFCYKIISKKILKPINNLKNDIIKYRKGIMPKRRKAVTTIDELQNNFIDLTVALESEKEKKNQIIASISHDIKTPLTSIMGYAKRLDTASLTEEKKIEYIKKINTKAIEMKELINEFDDYLGYNLNNTLNKKAVKIKDYIVTLKHEFEEDLKEKNVKFIIKNKLKENDEITIDEAKMKRVFGNVINNSLRYLEGNNKFIKIKIYNKDSKINFEIMDNGIGVEPDKLDKIFDPLFTSDPSRKISGLGLSICYEIIKAHNGSIVAKNNKYGGLSIIFNFKSNYDILNNRR